jgi:hypothetical protein
MKTHVRPGARKIFGAQPSSLHEHSGLLREYSPSKFGKAPWISERRSDLGDGSGPCLSCLHGHSALSRASSRRCGQRLFRGSL